MNARKVLVISLDCLRADTLFGERAMLGSHHRAPKDLRCPNLRRLIVNGRNYTHAVTTSPYTTAAHASAFTGCHPSRHGVRDYFRTPISLPTVFAIAHNEGIRTGFVTDYPLILGKHLGFDRGVSDFEIEAQDAALDRFLTSDGPNELLFVHFADLHFPYGCHLIREHREFLEAFLAFEARRLNVRLLTQPQDGSLEAVRSDTERCIEQNYRRVLGTLYNAGEFERLLMLYWQGLERFDAGRFKRFVNRLLESDFLSSGLMILFGDHGEDWSPSCWAHFDSCDRSVLNVPLILRGAGIDADESSDLVGLIDVAPTILDFFGLKHLSFHMDGCSLLGNSPRGERILYSECWLSDTSELVAFINKAHREGAIDDAPSLASWRAKDAAFSSDCWYQRYFAHDGKVTRREQGSFSSFDDLSKCDFPESTMNRHHATNPDPAAIVADLRQAFAQQGYFRRS